MGIAGAPPFALFLSEFTILRAGIAGPYRWAALLFIIFLIVIFIGFLSHFRDMCFAGDVTPAVHISGMFWRSLPMWLTFAPLLILGLWWPHELWSIFTEISATMFGGSR